MQQTLLFPLMILSGIMLPIEAGPEWMKVASLFNPLTYLVNAERELFAGAVGLDTLYGLAAAVGDGRRRTCCGHPDHQPEHQLGGPA